jgi:hypothetical protein
MYRLDNNVTVFTRFYVIWFEFLPLPCGVVVQTSHPGSVIGQPFAVSGGCEYPLWTASCRGSASSDSTTEQLILHQLGYRQPHEKMAEGLATENDAAASRASEQARLRKERRAAKIKAGGSARLDKINGMGGRVVGGKQTLFLHSMLPPLLETY